MISNIDMSTIFSTSHLISSLLVGMTLVESISYGWHRFAEHIGIFGKMVSYRHYIHHEKNYPVKNLRPQGITKYQTVHPWSWYIPTAITCGLVFFLLPLVYAVPIFIGGLIHGAFIVKLHETFHIENHWLTRFNWYRRLVSLHDIHHFGPWNYGIAFFWLDRFFGTLKEKPPYEREINFPSIASSK